jgi:hypothetical protein
MSSLGTGGIVFASIFGGAMLGMFLHDRLPADHLSTESRDVVKLGTGLIATMAALVLGLLTASAKGSFDAQKNEVQQSATNVVLLDRTLAQYGSEAAPIRAAVLVAVQRRIESIWPTGAEPIKIDDPQAVAGVEKINAALRALTPTDEAHRQLQAKALQLCDQLTQTRWLLAGQAAETSIPGPLLVVVVFWLTVVFVSFGILAPPNRTVGVVLALSALSVSGAIFLILEMDRPLQGLLKIPSDSLQYALAHLGQ